MSREFVRREGVFWWTLVLLLGVSFLFSLSVGSVFLSPLEVFRLLWTPDEVLGLIVRELRMPRTILALMVGGGLGLVGAALQGYTRNPLADSGLLGINGGAALGAVMVFYTGFWHGSGYSLGVPLGGLCGAIVATLLIVLLAGRLRSIQTLILAGVAVSSLAGALTSLVLNLSPNPFAAQEIVFWLLGSVADRSWEHVWFATPLVLIGAVVLFIGGRSLQALSLGEEVATSMGVSPKVLRWIIILGCALVVGPVTAVAGAIGFVGLVIPHLLRPFVGADPSRLLWASFLGGAVLLLWADILVRVMPLEQELKLGVVTALLGAPFFFWLIFHLRREFP